MRKGFVSIVEKHFRQERIGRQNTVRWSVQGKRLARKIESMQFVQSAEKNSEKDEVKANIAVTNVVHKAGQQKQQLNAMNVARSLKELIVILGDSIISVQESANGNGMQKQTKAKIMLTGMVGYIITMAIFS